MAVFVLLEVPCTAEHTNSALLRTPTEVNGERRAYVATSLFAAVVEKMRTEGDPCSQDRGGTHLYQKFMAHLVDML